MRRLFVDTSAWYAFANRSDPCHGRVGDALETFEGRLVTTNYVFDEVLTLCRKRLGHRQAVRVGAGLMDRDVIDLLCVQPEDERAAWGLFQMREDRYYSFTDCTSFGMMRRLGIALAAPLDVDGARGGFEDLQAI